MVWRLLQRGAGAELELRVAAAAAAGEEEGGAAGGGGATALFLAAQNGHAHVVAQLLAVMALEIGHTVAVAAAAAGAAGAVSAAEAAAAAGHEAIASSIAVRLKQVRRRPLMSAAAAAAVGRLPPPAPCGLPQCATGRRSAS